MIEMSPAEKKVMWIVGALEALANLARIEDEDRAWRMTVKGTSAWDQIDADPDSRPDDEFIWEYLSDAMSFLGDKDANVAHAALTEFRDNRDEMRDEFSQAMNDLLGEEEE